MMGSGTVLTLASEAEDLLRESLVWDMVYPLEPWAGNDIDSLLDLAECGYDVISLTIAGDDHNISQALQRVASARRQVLNRSDRFHFLHDIEDIERARAAGKLAVGIHFEGTRCFERNLDVIEAFVRLGVRHTLLAFNAGNSAGSGCAEKSDGGLTAYGRRLIAEMQRSGMLLDLSHTGFRTSMEAIEVSDRPVIFSHSNVHALAPSFRNLREEQIRACAAVGGVVGISGSSVYLGDVEVRPETLFRHIDHIAQMVGPHYVGLGIDVVRDAEAVSSWARNRPDEWPITQDPAWPGFRYFQPRKLLEVVELMLTAGYGADAVKAILGENHLRVCAKAWHG